MKNLRGTPDQIKECQSIYDSLQRTAREVITMNNNIGSYSGSMKWRLMSCAINTTPINDAELLISFYRKYLAAEIDLAQFERHLNLEL